MSKNNDEISKLSLGINNPLKINKDGLTIKPDSYITPLSTIKTDALLNTNYTLQKNSAILSTSQSPSLNFLNNNQNSFPLVYSVSEVPEGMTKKETELFVKKELEKQAKEFKDYLAEQENLRSKQVLSIEDVELLKNVFKALNNKPVRRDGTDWRRWVCPICKDFIDELTDIEKIENYIKNFNSNIFKKCGSRRHANLFSIKDGKIYYSIVEDITP